MLTIHTSLVSRGKHLPTVAPTAGTSPTGAPLRLRTVARDGQAISGQLAAASPAEPAVLERGGRAELAPDSLLPSQLDQVTQRVAPEHRLMLAVLEDAVRVYQVDCLSIHTGSRLRFRETAAWFASDDTSSPFCFVTICEFFGLDPDYVRGGLRRWKDTRTSGAPRTGRVIPFPTQHVAGSLPRSPVVPTPAPAATDTPCEILAEGVSSAPVPDFVTSIRQAVETLSGGDAYPSVQQTANFVGISVRTLQRSLAARGVNHEALVAETRFAAAAALLERADGTILDIALSLGYSDHANFSRAFRRWAGCSPREYRLRCGRTRQVRPAAERPSCEAQRRHRRAS